jgi:hypothetical protein
MRKIKQFFKSKDRSYTLLLRIIHFARELTVFRAYSRYKFATSYYREKYVLINKWIFKRTEDDNFYYDLTEKNRKDLVSMLSCILNLPINLLIEYQSEIVENTILRLKLENSLRSKLQLSDLNLGFGRREAWYIIIRCLKPKLVVETGVHHGVGACVIASALHKNREEGHLGEYLGVDIDPKAGTLFKELFNEFGDVIIGDSLGVLKNVIKKIDLFINDSDHSSDYEEREFQLIKDLMSQKGIILGDNSHTNSILRDFSMQNERRFIFFSEQPLNHWYPGAGVGISLPKELKL